MPHTPSPLPECTQCDGIGHYWIEKDFGSGRISEWNRTCPRCQGTGHAEPIILQPAA